MIIIKRNGQEVQFDKQKIENAILKAMKYGSGIIDHEVAQKVANIVEAKISENLMPTVKQIEILVHQELVGCGHIETARYYEGYRAVAEFKRQNNTNDDDILGLINGTNKSVMTENSNKNAKIASTQRDLVAGEVSKDIARRKLIPTRIIQAHDNGVLHYHDMDYAMQSIFNCCLVNIGDMLDNGTVINGKMVETPKSFQKACTIMTQIMAQIASGQYGGQSMNIKHLGKYLRRTYNKAYSKYLAKYKNVELATDLAHDYMMEELKNGVQTIQYQINTLQTSNGC